MERDTPCTYTVLAVKKGYTQHIHTAWGGNGYILMPSVLAVKMDTPSRLYYWWWKGMHPSIYNVECGKGEKGDTPTHTLLV
jgi:hypothetical protein